MDQAQQLPTYFAKATTALAKLGIPLSTAPNAAVAGMVERLAGLDANRVMNIGRVMHQATVFNAMVRDQIGGMQVSNRYLQITDAFTSIRDDSQQMAAMMVDGKVDVTERVKLIWMRVSRGSIPDRFDAIKKTYLDVTQSAGDQIKRERLILEAYIDFRMALKEAEVDATELKREAFDRLEKSREAVAAAQSAVAQHTSPDDAGKARLELARDEAIRALQEEDKRFQLAKDLSENLKIAYNSAEVIFARLQQTLGVKERVYDQARTFFSTNEVVFSAMAASFTSMQGLNEATKTLEAMKEGVNEGLETLAEAGGADLEAGLRAGYGPTIKAESLQALVTAIGDFQEKTHHLITELREESEKNAMEVQRVVEDGKARFLSLAASPVSASVH